MTSFVILWDSAKAQQVSGKDFSDLIQSYHSFYPLTEANGTWLNNLRMKTPRIVQSGGETGT